MIPAIEEKNRRWRVADLAWLIENSKDCTIRQMQKRFDRTHSSIASILCKYNLPYRHNEGDAEREPFHLPIKTKPEPLHILRIRMFTKKVVAAAKKVAIASLHGKELNMDDTIEAILLQVDSNGYNRGLADNDKMHKAV